MASKAQKLEKRPIYRSLIRTPKYAGIGFGFLVMECSVVGALTIMLGWQWLTLGIIVAVVLVVHPAMVWICKKDVLMPSFLTRHFMQQNYWLPHPKVRDGGGDKVHPSIPDD